MKSALYEIAAPQVPERDDYEELAQKARRSGDEELADFFLRVNRERMGHAEEAEKLLASRLAE